MLREFTLQPNEEKRIQVEGKFLVVTKAAGPVELTIGGTTPVTVDLHDRVHLRDDSPNDRSIRIKNISGGVNVFEMHTSDLLVDKRQAIDVKESIKIAPNQRVGIDPDVNIVQAIIQNAIQIDPASNVIRIDDGELIGIDPNANIVQAIIKNAIALEPKQSICIDPECNTVKLNEKSYRYQNLPTIVIENKNKDDDDDDDDDDDNGNQTITITIGANPLREQLILTSDHTNAKSVWIGGVEDEGIPLAPDKRIILDTGEAITLAAKKQHRIYVAERIRVESPS